MTIYAALQDAIICGHEKVAVSEAKKLLYSRQEPVDLVSNGINPAMSKISHRFEIGDCFVPELLLAARAAEGVFQILRPLLAKSDVKPKARVVLGTVRGDLHDIGKNIVAAMLKGGGFEVIDLGVDVPAERFVAAARDEQVQIVGLSALLTSTLPAMESTVKAFKDAGLRDKFKIIIGGSPVKPEDVTHFGADGYAETAVESVQLACHLAEVQQS